MSELKQLLNDIEDLRSTLIKVVEQRNGDFQDPDVLAASQSLNDKITEYNELLKEKTVKA